MFVGGAWVPARSHETTTATSPATGETLGRVPQGDRDDARAAIAAARGAAQGWARLSAFDRAALLHRVGDVIESRRDELARTLTLDQGKPLRAEAYDEVDELVTYWRMAAEDGKRLGGQLPNSASAGKRALLIRRPRGVVGVITPWNWPYTMPAELIAPALASGNTVVWTPAPSTSVAAVALAGCVADADLPPGVLNLVTGPGPVVGDEIARNPGTDAVAFIGSTATGQRVAAAAAGKATLLEMGGNGPVVVMPDADLERAVDGVLTACFLCAGQSCTAGERLLVHHEVRGEFARLLTAAVRERVRLGDPFDDTTTMGPLNNPDVADKMDRHVADALERGASLLIGGSRDNSYKSDLYWQATVLDGVPADALVAVEETFGPVAPIIGIGSLAEAVEMTNSSPYGLLAAIYTGDLRTGLDFADAVRTGWVNINESSNYWESHLPFGGRSGSGSGLGRVGGSHPMEAFTELQTVIIG
ncbi:succinate-semialdehyde dehydrogenase/glutarate-semialdehyde dehydrogenase [Paractinoplanes brasiliensis]|uniref:Succinate-semialdehyde dehydrogenase/glutarate-semialdehyde dehydrogenase n=2 Tax=Paractinoplanes brasiliensis TaxID=52695 RepID=A0A4R6JAN1_9ACTN|nr:succinate-semialdehyde dehydrogenase/glutarate-semialdehyde dehydrogenase [Actinoplanes brasiliensis]